MFCYEQIEPALRVRIPDAPKLTEPRPVFPIYEPNCSDTSKEGLSRTHKKRIRNIRSLNRIMRFFKKYHKNTCKSTFREIYYVNCKQNISRLCNKSKNSANDLFKAFVYIDSPIQNQIFGFFNQIIQENVM